MKANKKIWKINKRCWWEIAFLVLCSIASVGLIIMPVHAEEKCPHIDIIKERINSSSCTANGTINERCGVCGEVFTVFKEEKLEHPLAEYELVKPAGPNENGLLEAKCTQCDFISYMDYICSHEGTYTEESAVADCENEGAIDTLCYECHTILEQEIVPALGHDFGGWSIVKYAIPESSGTKQRVCGVCTKTESQSYAFSMPENGMYVPGTDFNHSFVIAEMSQDSVDRYDLVYDSSYFGTAGPWILGHNTGSMRYLPQIKVGSIVYISVGGNISRYKVQISESAMQNSSWTDIIGNNSGKSIFSNMGGATLRMYTCYGGTNGRWIVLATKC